MEVDDPLSDHDRAALLSVPTRRERQSARPCVPPRPQVRDPRSILSPGAYRGLRGLVVVPGEEGLTPKDGSRGCCPCVAEPYTSHPLLARVAGANVGRDSRHQLSEACRPVTEGIGDGTEVGRDVPHCAGDFDSVPIRLSQGVLEDLKEATRPGERGRH